jgi:hypothetical protein
VGLLTERVVLVSGGGQGVVTGSVIDWDQKVAGAFD